MFKDLLIHPATAYQLKALIEGQPHAIIVSGGSGSGKNTISRMLISGLIGKENVINDPYFLEIISDTPSIGIESIREIRDFLSRKTTGTSAIRRIVLIQNAHTMTQEAQNTLLKTLEEPPADTAVVLTTDNLLALRQTIRSRSQQLMVLPVDYKSAIYHFVNLGHTENDVRAAYFMSDGRMGLLTEILNQSHEHALVVAINQAKEFIKMGVYERLVNVELLSKQKDQTRMLIEALGRVVSSGLRQSAETNNKPALKRFYTLSTLVYEAQAALDKNVNAKLVLARLFNTM